MCVHRIFLPSLVSPIGQELKKLNTNQGFTYKTYTNTTISHLVAPPCVKLHAEISPAVGVVGQNNLRSGAFHVITF